MQNDQQSLDLKQKQIDLYLRDLFSQKHHYCYVLFQFIEFDPIREKQSEFFQNTPRESHLAEELSNLKAITEDKSIAASSSPQKLVGKNLNDQFS